MLVYPQLHLLFEPKRVELPRAFEATLDHAPVEAVVHPHHEAGIRQRLAHPAGERVQRAVFTGEKRAAIEDREFFTGCRTVWSGHSHGFLPPRTDRLTARRSHYRMPC